MGGDNTKSNLVRLLPEEHYLAHQLLVKIYPTNTKLVYAANMLTMGPARSNKQYGWIKRKLSVIMSNRIVADSTKIKLSVSAKTRIKEYGHPQGMLGKHHSVEAKSAMTTARTGVGNGMWGKHHSEPALAKMRAHQKTLDHIRKLSERKQGENHWNFGKHLSEITRLKQSDTHKNAPTVICPHCSKSGKKSPMMRWHFNNCKLILKDDVQ
jgi:hypothetical protein